jgi:hypothetical protein
MRITGPNTIVQNATVGSARRSTSAFVLPEATSASESRAATAPRATGGIDALLAMQGVEDPTEKRKRSVRRGRDALDVLEKLKIGLLAGTMGPATVEQLRNAAASLKDSSGDPGLDAVLAEIELRVEVELAKVAR